MMQQRYYVTIMPRGEIVQRFLYPHEAEVYARTFNRVMRDTDIHAEVVAEAGILKVRQ